MIGRLPERLDPREAARNGLAGSGAVSLAALERLADLLVEPYGQAEVVLAARVDEGGWHVLEGRVAAAATALCQRCLEPMAVTLDAPFVLAAVDDDVQAAELPEPYEPLCVKECESIALADLVEDELLLVFPAHVRHPAARCRAAHGEEERAPGNGVLRRPFAALETLRRH
jgi:uncharacterized protein